MDDILWIVALGAVAAGFVQGLSGFAFGLVAMSFWAWSLEPQLAAALSVFGALTGQIIAAVTMRRGMHFSLLWPFLAGGLIGMPIGLFVLPLLNVALFKAFLGALLVLWCPAMLVSSRLPRISNPPRWADALAGLIGGVMGGLGGFAGAVPTLWCLLCGYDKDRQRAVIQNFNLTILATAMLGYALTGLASWSMLPYFGVVALAVLVPVLLGARLYIGISEAQFRMIVLSLLTASGVALLASSLPKLLTS